MNANKMYNELKVALPHFIVASPHTYWQPRVEFFCCALQGRNILVVTYI